MNLINEEFETKKTDNSKKLGKVILIFIVILIIAIIGIFIAIVYMEESTLKLKINGIENKDVKEMMVTEADGTIYFPIREIAPYLGYESYSGEYTEKSEEASKCYVQCTDEIANFALNSNKIYKLVITDSTANYEYFYATKPVKAINGKLYATVDAIENAFNISFAFETENRINIYTMPYLIEAYTTKVLDYGFETISEVFANKKTVLNDILVVTKNENATYAVIDVNGNSIIEAKYDYIEYLPNSGDFLVKSNNKVGIISVKKETKVPILYDSLELIDQDIGLYVAKIENKYGVVDSKGNIKIYIEYDQIGIDSTQFEKNDIKNKYLLDNGMIPVRKDKLWGAFDKNGNEILKLEYESFGYIAQTNKDALNLLMVPDYNVMVAKKDGKYTLINSVGEEICFPVLDDVYMTISSGEKNYYMNWGENIGISVIEFLDIVSAQQQANNNNNSATDEQEESEDEVTNETETETDVVEESDEFTDVEE